MKLIVLEGPEVG